MVELRRRLSRVGSPSRLLGQEWLFEPTLLKRQRHPFDYPHRTREFNSACLRSCRKAAAIMEDVDFPSLFRPLTIQLGVLRKYKFLTELELEGCKNFRGYYEHVLGKKFITYDEILTFLKSELNLLYEMKQKQVDERLLEKKNIIMMCSSDFLKRLLAIVTSHFPDEIRLWLIYVSFLKSIKDATTMSGVLKEFVKIHKETPTVFQIASRLAREDLKNHEVARMYVASGLRLHEDSNELHKEAFILELNIAQEEYEQSILENRVVDLTALAKMAEFAYVTARLRINDVEFYLDLFHLARRFSCARGIECRIRRDLQQTFPREETMWDALTKVKLEQLKDDANRPFYRTIIIEVIEMYETILEQHLDTPEMWSLYLDQLLEIEKDSNVDLPKFKRNCILTALNTAYQKNRLSEKYYLIWCEMQKGDEQKIQLLRKAAAKLPSSVALWVKMFTIQMSLNNEEKVWEIFQESLLHFQNDKAATLTLWEKILRYYMVFCPRRVEWCFREAIKSRVVSAEFKPKYLEWLILKQGIEAGSSYYDEICSAPPFSVGLHEKMVEFGSYQVNPANPIVKSVRNAHSVLTERFGAEDVSVWMKWIHFESLVTRSQKSVKRIKDRAMKLLQPRLIQDFFFDIERFGTISVTLPRPEKKPEAGTSGSQTCKVNETRNKWKAESTKNVERKPTNRRAKNHEKKTMKLFVQSGLRDIQPDSD
ncbi:hypothetical protein GE061_000301 [Apolygus lucorum]|uniref:U3 small nucleolar RNA-associated protein 6 homolog C-terminal domain-containing protein n=1 Tax=Apolygus lucorum TaxID=248454 RepID=A0A8S9Y569_APOLU|nr:hypothetical protein GE061_000301 [Apolygus lucorum]